MEKNKRKIFNLISTSILTTSIISSFNITNSYAQIADPIMNTPKQTIVGNTINVGETKMITIPKNARQITNGNSNIIEASLTQGRKLQLTAINVGKVEIFIQDEKGKIIDTIKLTSVKNLNDLKNMISSSLPTSNVTPSIVGNTIFLTGEVDSAQDAAIAISIAQSYAKSNDILPIQNQGSNAPKELSVINGLTIRGKQQVRLNVKIAEVQRKVVKQLGVSSNGEWTVRGVDLAGAFIPNFGVNGQFNSNSYLSATGKNGSVTLQALEEMGVAKILAEPNVTVLSGETGNIFSGGEQPIPTGITCTDGNICQPSIEYKKYGVTLNMTPVVAADGKIALAVSTKVSAVDPTNQLSIPYSDTQSLTVPGFKERSSQTTIVLPSGGSMVGAGLIQQDMKRDLSGYPGIKNIPIIGALFRSNDYVNAESELMIIITPYLVNSSTEKALGSPTDGFTNSSEPEAIFLGQANKVAGRQQKMPGQKYIGEPGFIAE